MSKTEITIADGKYTVIFDGGYLSALRYGEPWRDLTGDNLIYWMMVEIEGLRATNELLNQDLQELKENRGA